VNFIFDWQNVTITEFGVGRDDADPPFSVLPVDPEVQTALRQMCAATWSAMQKLTTNPPHYEPSEKYASHEYVYLPFGDDLAERMRQLHNAANLPTDSSALEQASKIFCYFVRLTDGQGQRLTALRRAAQFKGILKSHLIRFVTDSLKLIEDKVFKLDVDFDLLVDSQNVHILRPDAFGFASQLQQAILSAVPKNVAAIRHDLNFVEFSGIQEYASRHTRAARYLASIRSQHETKNVDKAALKKLCKSNNVEIKEANGKIHVEEDSVMDFLEVLDRRRYQLELVKGSPERFKAASRSRLRN